MVSRRSGNRRAIRWKVAPAVLMVLALLGAMAVAALRAPTVRAQGTPEAPAAGSCEAPALPPGTPTPMEASPAAEMEMGTPEATEAEATAEVPAPTPAPPGTPAAEDVAAAATAAIENIFTCWNSQDYEAYAALHSENGLMQEFETTNPYDAVASLQRFPQPPVLRLSTGDAQTLDDGRISIDTTYTLGEYQYFHKRYYLVQEGEYWLVDATQSLPAAPEGDTTAFGVTMTEYAFTPNIDTVTATDVLIIHGTNAGVEPHEILLIKLPEGADPAGLLDGSITEDQIEFIGDRFFLPGEAGDMVLVNVPAGVYTMVCFVTAPDGQPHLAKGMFTTITVEAPAAPSTPAA